ncbi:formylglycine-generating enzyme family protein, partial [Streptomyces galilaeus]|uniref:formylglycine-generating enzyme family protein n=1 Tax=Streptomyces galilaeus TaxID=33899 RepID=UPI0038F5FCA7
EWFFGDDQKAVGQFAWYDANAGKQTHPVGQLQPNAFGVFDIIGNVWQWTEDCYHETYQGAPVTAAAWVDDAGCSRVYRGGGW